MNNKLSVLNMSLVYKNTNICIHAQPVINARKGHVPRVLIIKKRMEHDKVNKQEQKTKGINNISAQTQMLNKELEYVNNNNASSENKQTRASKHASAVWRKEQLAQTRKTIHSNKTVNPE